MASPRFLYKVSPPREDMLFRPSTFWHSSDWESSTTRERVRYVREELLYAGDFEEVNIHLFPRVRTVRVRSTGADAAVLSSLGIRCTPGKSAWIFVSQLRREDVEAFSPTIFTFRADGFVRVRNGEYVSREPQRALSSETIGMPEALDRWNVEACYSDDLDALISRLKDAGTYCDIQT